MYILTSNLFKIINMYLRLKIRMVLGKILEVLIIIEICVLDTFKNNVQNRVFDTQ